MKKIAAVLITLLVLICADAQAARHSFTKPYFRKGGTYVHSHFQRPHRIVSHSHRTRRYHRKSH